MPKPVVPLPLYTLLGSQHEPYPVFYQVKDQYYLSLFTSKENAEAYIARDRTEMVPLRLADLDAACHFIRSHRPNTESGEFRILLDRIGPDTELHTFDVPYFLSLLKIGREQPPGNSPPYPSAILGYGGHAGNLSTSRKYCQSSIDNGRGRCL